MGIGVSLAGYEAEVVLIPLELRDFDVILSMDWLRKYKAQIDCYTKTLTFQIPEGGRMVFEGERTPNQINLVLVVTARKLLRKGCMGYLAYILKFDGESPRLKDIPVVKEFLDVFPEKLLGTAPRTRGRSVYKYFSRSATYSSTTILDCSGRTVWAKDSTTRVVR